MEMNHNSMSGRRQRGFSLLELTLSLAILGIVISVAVDGITVFQQRNTTEVNNVGDTQEARQFMDQILNDLRQAKYPSIGMFDPTTLTSSTNCALDNNVSCGLISLSSTAIQFEGDVDGSGVSEVYIQLVEPGTSTTCTVAPCTLQRGTVLKSVGGTPAYYTEVDNVMTPAIFSAFDYGGNTISLPASATDLPNIKNIGINLGVRASSVDLKTGIYPVITMVSEARVNN
jgi:prepilin-type N-terminal cleavage/methylation domain-containing protein